MLVVELKLTERGIQPLLGVAIKFAAGQFMVKKSVELYVSTHPKSSVTVKLALYVPHAT